jgi:uncharacterized protein YbbK (DUF523 family)/uncharacterized protein YbgA (DUF1722 family)
MNIGISSCLLGQNVRWNGSNRLDKFLSETLGKYVQWIPACPEVESGLSVPRKPLHLVEINKKTCVLTSDNQCDYTDKIVEWSTCHVRALKSQNLCGYIFKSKSPSCGLDKIKKHSLSGNYLSNNSRGLFVSQLLKSLPQLPVIDDGRLHDSILKENFIQTVFTINRWKNLVSDGITLNDLISFNTNHKLLFLTHSPRRTFMLQYLIFNDTYALSQKVSLYEEDFRDLLKIQSTRQRIANVLTYCTLYLKKYLSVYEQKELRVLITEYFKGYIPLIAPITLIKHYASIFNDEFLNHQIFLAPYPDELRLRNEI